MSERDLSPLFRKQFPPEEFSARRSRLFDQIGSEACALVQGAGPVERSEPFRQSNEFYYLCGVETPQSLLFLDGRARKSALFLPHSSERQERIEGPALSAEDAAAIRQITGLDEVEAPEDLARRLEGFTTLYTPHSPAEGPAMYRDDLLWSARLIMEDPWDGCPGREQRLVQRLQFRTPSLQIADLSPILDSLRIIKSPTEIELMRRAGQLTALGVCEAMRCTRPGIMEYQLGAIAKYVHRINGASGDGYRAIIASGPNIWLMHYFRNNRMMEDGDVVLVDYAPDYAYYTSDIGRTWPVNGRFTGWQRELYGFITRYHQELLKRIRPGVLPAKVLEEAADAMRPVIEAATFSNPAFVEAARETLKFRGHLSHPVGMAVHDVGAYWDRPMQPGLVISVDPQLWVPSEKLYIRVEDTVVLTEDSMENLTALAPLELDAIEAMVGQSGLMQAYPPVE